MKNIAYGEIFCPLCLKYPLVNNNQGLLCKLCGYAIKSKEEYLQLSQALKKEIENHSVHCQNKARIIFVNEITVHGVCFICTTCYRVYSKELSK